MSQGKAVVPQRAIDFIGGLVRFPELNGGGVEVHPRETVGDQRFGAREIVPLKSDLRRQPDQVGPRCRRFPAACMGKGFTEEPMSGLNLSGLQLHAHDIAHDARDQQLVSHPVRKGQRLAVFRFRLCKSAQLLKSACSIVVDRQEQAGIAGMSAQSLIEIPQRIDGVVGISVEQPDTQQRDRL